MSKFTSNFTGVSYNKQNKNYRSVISINTKNLNIGSFKTEEEASECYQKALHNYNNNLPVYNKKGKIIYENTL